MNIGFQSIMRPAVGGLLGFQSTQVPEGPKKNCLNALLSLFSIRDDAVPETSEL